jgi:two-component system, cell cycle sensor histidine kinase and response regulator CckA
MDLTSKPQPEKFRQKILIVDDLEENLFFLQKIIKRIDVEILTAESGDAAIEIVNNHTISLIILDVVMPGMDGYQLADLLRKNPHSKELPLIFITGSHPNDKDLLKGYELGAIDYIIKPFPPEVLTRKISILLEIERKIKELEQERAELRQRDSERIKELALTNKSLHQSRQTALTMMEDAVQAKNLAEESAARYRMLFKNLPSGFALHEMIYDTKGQAVDYRFLQVNPAFEILTGLKAETLIGKTVKEVLPGTESHWIDLYAQVVESGEPAFYENYSKELDKYFNVRAYRPAPGQFAVLFSDVTKSRRTAENLKLTQFAVDHLQDAVYWCDLDGKFSYVNDAACREMGYRREELLKMDLWEVDPDTTPESWKMTVTTLLAQSDLTMERLHQRKDGSRYPVEVKASYVEFGGRKLICGIAHNISERKQMQAAIEKRILALTLPLDDADDIAFETLFNLQDIQRIQDEFAAATNVASIITSPKGEPITRPSNFTDLCECIRGTAKGCANCIISDAKLGRIYHSGPIIHPCLSGGLWDASASITVGGKHVANWLIGQVRDENQTEAQMVAYAREIGADEKEIMEAFRRAPSMSKARFQHVAEALYTLANQLSTSAYQNIQQARFIADEKRRTQELRRLSTAIEQSPEVIVITDTHGVIEYANPAFERSTGYACAEAIGQKPSLIKSGKHSRAFYDEIWATLGSGKIWQGRITNKRKDGSLYTEEAVISPVKSPAGTITNYVAVKRDITQELVREEQMQQAQKMEAVGQLAGGIAHDFNNILQTIMGFSDLLLLTLEDPNELARKNVEEIQKAAQHAADLTRQLLAFSRKQHVEFAIINLNDLITNTKGFVTSILGENIVLKMELSPETHPVNADARQLERTILNMALNARDAMPKGGTLTIRTENTSFDTADISTNPHAKSGDYVCLSICDTGSGMTQDIIGHIFEPFFSTKGPGKGTGLGLAAIYGIIQKHQGWINVYSEPNKGSVFKIYLPAKIDASQPLEHKPKDQQSMIQEGNGQRILVVEDSEAILKLSINTLEKAGYVVFSAKSAEEAETIFDKEQGNFDLLFSDVILPEKNGADLAVSLCKIKPDLQVLLCSGYTGNRIASSGAALEDFFFMEKPFSMGHLLNEVYGILAKTK